MATLCINIHWLSLSLYICIRKEEDVNVRHYDAVSTPYGTITYDYTTVSRVVRVLLAGVGGNLPFVLFTSAFSKVPYTIPLLKEQHLVQKKLHLAALVAQR